MPRGAHPYALFHRRIDIPNGQVRHVPAEFLVQRVSNRSSADIDRKFAVYDKRTDNPLANTPIPLYRHPNIAREALDTTRLCLKPIENGSPKGLMNDP